MAKNRIYVELSTFENLKDMKVKMNKVSFDDVIKELIRLTHARETVEKISNSDLLLDGKKNYNQMLKRLEALHDRFGYYEKNYFTKIVDIADDIADGVLPNRIEEIVEKNDKNEVNNLNVGDESNLLKRYNELESIYEELRMTSKNNTTKIRTLKNKISKKSGVFASGYDLNLSEEEYNSIFN